MKGTDIALIIFIALISIGVSFWLANTILGDPNDRTALSRLRFALMMIWYDWGQKKPYAKPV